MNDSIVSALIVGGLIGGSILMSGRNGAHTEGHEIRMFRRGGDGEQIRMLRRGGDGEQIHLEMMDVMGGEADFEFEGTISELENLDLESFDEELQETINNAIDQAGSRDEDGKIKIVLRKGG
tara:strand:+ start:2196 stop:2561 length:366 start_codon:yes stop_codon:yes gene_type:complete